jgi:hypothetical protein
MDTDRQLPHLKEELWIQTHHHYLTLSAITIIIPEITIPELKRTHDRVIMDIATDGTSFSNSEIGIYLHEEVISDMTSADGSNIPQSVQACHPSAVLHASTNHIKIWKRFLIFTDLGRLRIAASHMGNEPHQKNLAISTTTLETILLQPKMLYIVSDGSVKSDIVSFGWVMASPNELTCTSQGRLPPNSMNSFRAECGGILSWLVFLRHYTQQRGIQPIPVHHTTVLRQPVHSGVCTFLTHLFRENKLER